jgi:SAM-dependent methyltransferase
VGPGLNPQVWPAEGRSVRYVEALSAEHWIRLYKKGPSPARHSLEPLWSQYVIASAERLEMAADASLDFVFSNHVFEHLVNPMGVLENWLRKLRPGGLIAGVVPDARYSFDLRQPWSTFDEITAEQVAGSFEVSRKKYEKWCRYTAPYNTPEDLVARQYSIHAHYYVPELFAKIGGSLRQRGLIGGLFLETVPNNKDFGFVFWKPELSPQKQASIRVAP